MKRYIRNSSNAPKLSRKIYPRLQWDNNGHLFEVIRVDDYRGTALVSEDWISDDTGKEMHVEDEWYINDDNGSEFICPDENPNYKLYAVNALNSAEVRDYEESFREWDNREPEYN